MAEAHDTTESAEWARALAASNPEELVRNFAARVEGLHFRARAIVLDAALAARHELGVPLCRALRERITDDELRATIESLPPTTMSPLLCALAATPDALFALALAAWPGPLSCVSLARTHPSWPGDDHARHALLTILQGPYRASARVRALFEIVSMGSHPESMQAIERLLDDPVHDLRTAAVRALARLNALDSLLVALDSPLATVRTDARMMLVQLVSRGDVARAPVVAALTKIASDRAENARERYECRRALREMGEAVERVEWSGIHQDAAESLAHEIKSMANRVAISEYVSVLADADDPRGLDAVREALAQPTKVGRALAGFRPFFKGPSGAQALRELLRDRDPIVRERAGELSKMRG
jgi:RNA polymerase-interacting CarD/CdnL/TRCF family regulator